MRQSFDFTRVSSCRRGSRGTFAKTGCMLNEQLVIDDCDPVDCTNELFTPPLTNGELASLYANQTRLPMGYQWEYLIDLLSPRIRDVPCDIQYPESCNIENGQVCAYANFSKPTLRIFVVSIVAYFLLQLSGTTSFDTKSAAHAMSSEGLGGIFIAIAGCSIDRFIQAFLLILFDGIKLIVAMSVPVCLELALTFPCFFFESE